MCGIFGVSIYLALSICLPALALAGGTQQGEKASLSVDANIVFFYYEDLDRALRFYEDTLGLELVLDYGFAKVLIISPTSYIGLVDEKEGMHRASEPKTVTLSFVTDEIDAWYRHLTARGVTIRSELGDATRHPTRGFVAADPEGYYLEFERFLDHPQNEMLRKHLSSFEHRYGNGRRPEDLGVAASIVWLYYKDIPQAQGFYEGVLGMGLILDQGFTKVYTSSPTCLIGLVDESKGLHSFTEEKAVTIAFVTERIKEWNRALEERKAGFIHPLSEAGGEPVISLVIADTAGYYLEFNTFPEDEKNSRILRNLNKMRR